MGHIPSSTPAIITVHHHEFLPQLRKWVKSGKVKTPFSVVNIDEHHDYYNPPSSDGLGRRLDCGNWGLHIPLDWYDRYTWVYNSHGTFNGWSGAEIWLSDNLIRYSRRREHRIDRLRTEIVAAIFCVSPDYLEEDMELFGTNAVEIIADHFGLTKAPKTIRDTEVSTVDGWRIAPRPAAASLCGVG